ncbi:MAG: hypothetical protein H6818_02750 [Phycisphaerales bacterium]|nr:hypothetical protein [Phycisphaerales bacterium]MCB9863235.1 hypothetical protein [Phycisphaerales bacterium]
MACRLTTFFLVAISLSLIAGADCEDTGLNIPDPIATSLSVAPEDQDISDTDTAILAAMPENPPAASTDADGIHADPRLRWTITQGGGGLRAFSVDEAAPEKSPTIDTDIGDGFSNVVEYVPDSGASGEVRIKVEVYRPTDRIDVNSFGEPVMEHEDIVVASAEAVVHVNDALRLKLTPKATTLPAGGVVSLKAVFTSDGSDGREGQIISAPASVKSIEYEWHYFGLAGAADLQSDPNSDTAVFKAFNEAAAFTITVKATVTYDDDRVEVNGPASATVQIDPKLKTVNTFGYYLSKDESTESDFYYVVAFVYVPKIQGAISYAVVGQDMHDDAFYGTGANWAFSQAGGSFSGLEDVGGDYRFGLSSASGAIASGGLGGAYSWMESRFSGMRVIVTAVVQE